MALFRDTAALVNLSPSASWSQNATTVAGRADGTNGSSIGYLYSNEGLSISSDDTLFIGDVGNNRIVIVELHNTTNVRIFGSGPGSNVSQFNYPTDVVATETDIFIADVYNFRVQKWLRNGTNPITILNSSSISLSFFLFVDNYNYLYVSDCNANRVQRFGPNWSNHVNVAGNGVGGSSASQLSCPLGIFVDDVNTVYVADYVNHRIQKWANGTSSGVMVAGSGLAGSSLSRLSWPKGIVVDTNGYMYITDNGNNRILRWAPGATSGVCIIGCTGNSGNQANQLNDPSCLAFDSNRSIYVGDRGNNRVQKFQILRNDNYSMTTAQITTQITAQTTVGSTIFNSSRAALQQSLTATTTSTISTTHTVTTISTAHTVTTIFLKASASLTASTTAIQAGFAVIPYFLYFLYF